VYLYRTRAVKATRGDGCAMALCKNRGMSQTSLLPREMLYSEAEAALVGSRRVTRGGE
jgi:hypothetical protein